MPSTENNNKRIAKNTLMLYFRMLLTMSVSLITVRVVFQVLGEVNYGLFNVVGGVVTMFSFLSGTMISASQRFFSYEIGRNNYIQLKKTFSMTMCIYAIIALAIFILTETIGLWFLNVKMTIPPERLSAAHWVYQFSIFSFMMTLFTIPYDALIIAHEKMNVYAWVSIVEAVMKLLIVYLLTLFSFDKLKLYAVLIFLVTTLVTLIYRTYCRVKFEECRKVSFYWNASLFKEIISYSGWNLIGSLASIGKNQGLNILLNVFFNPIVNASMAMASQVNGIISQLIGNMYLSTRPQITKYYSQGDYKNMWKITFSSAKITFFMYTLISIPLFFEIDYVLSIWLKKPPVQASLFLRFLLINYLIECIFNQIAAVFQASNRLKKIQSFDSTLVILLLPISYVCLIFYKNANIPFIIMILLSLIRIFTYLYIAKIEVGLSVGSFFKKIVSREVCVLCLSLIVPILISFLNLGELQNFLCLCSLTTIASLAIIWFIGLEKFERIAFVAFIAKKYIKK